MLKGIFVFRETKDNVFDADDDVVKLALSVYADRTDKDLRGNLEDAFPVGGEFVHDKRHDLSKLAET